MAAPLIYCPSSKHDPPPRSSAPLLRGSPREGTPAPLIYHPYSNHDPSPRTSTPLLRGSPGETTLPMAAPCFNSDEAHVQALLKAALDGNLNGLKGIVKSIAKGNGNPYGVFSFSMGGVGVLHVAAGAGHLHICKYLVEELGGDVNAPGCGARAQGATPFMKAAQSGHLPTVQYFLNNGGDLMKADDKGRTVLHHAAGTGSCRVTEFLLAQGMPVDLDFGRGTPLLMACINEKDKTLKILLDHHANPNISGVGVPLLSALVYRSLKCMKLLIKAGADVNFKDSMVNPLLFATMHGGYTNYIKLLLKAGADPNIPDDLGRLPIELSSLRDCSEEVEMLFPLTTRIPNAPVWSIEGVISYAKVQDKKPIEQQYLERRNALIKSQADAAFQQVRWRQEAGKTEVIADMTSERKGKGQTDGSLSRESDYTVKIQLFVVFGKLKIRVHVPLQTTVREVVSRASRKLGVVVYDYYIIYCSRILDLDDTIGSQHVLSDSFLIPTRRLRGGAPAPQRMRWLEPLVDYTHAFGDELFDLCSIPNNGISVCLGQPGALICFQLIRMVHILFQNGICAPVFSSEDILFDHSTGCFSFRADFDTFENITDDAFASSMRCLAYIFRRTFRYAPARVQQGLRVIRVLVHGEDTTEVMGQLPDYVAYLVTELMDIAAIHPDANVDELMAYFTSHIASKNSVVRLDYQLGAALHMKSYRGGHAAFSRCMEALTERWTDAMATNPLNKVRHFGKLSATDALSLAKFSQHIRNFISHSDGHKMSQKQAEALVMLKASRFVHLLARELSLKIPVNTRLGGVGGIRVPVMVPTSPANLNAVNGYTARQIGEM